METRPKTDNCIVVKRLVRWPCPWYLRRSRFFMREMTRSMASEIRLMLGNLNVASVRSFRPPPCIRHLAHRVRAVQPLVSGARGARVAVPGVDRAPGTLCAAVFAVRRGRAPNHRGRPSTSPRSATAPLLLLQSNSTDVECCGRRECSRDAREDLQVEAPPDHSRL